MAEELDSLRDDATLVLDDAPTWRAFADELRAACFLALGKAAVARDILEAIEADETDAARLTPDGRVLLGDCLAQLGRDAEAREVWRALHEASVDSIRAHHDAAERLSRTTSPYR